MTKQHAKQVSYENNHSIISCEILCWNCSFSCLALFTFKNLYHLSTHNFYSDGISQGCTIPRHLVTWMTKFCTVAPNIFSIIIVVFFIVHTKLCNCLHAPTRKHHMLVRFTGRSRTSGPHDGNCTKNLEVEPRLLKNLQTPGINRFLYVTSNFHKNLILLVLHDVIKFC